MLRTQPTRRQAYTADTDRKSQSISDREMYDNMSRGIFSPHDRDPAQLPTPDTAVGAVET